MVKRNIEGRQCAYCDQPATTRDHILPREYRVALDQDIRNLRPACERCNSLRSTCAHCPAFLAITLTVAAELGLTGQALLRRWRFLVRKRPWRRLPMQNPAPPTLRTVWGRRL